MTDISAYELEVLRAMRWIELFKENDPLTLAAIKDALPRQRHGFHAAHTPAAVTAYAPRELFRHLAGVAKKALSATQAAVENRGDLEATLATMRKRDLVYVNAPMIQSPVTTYSIGSTGRRYIMNNHPDMRNRFSFEQAALDNI